MFQNLKLLLIVFIVMNLASSSVFGAEDPCKSKKLNEFFLNGEPNGKQVRYYENTDPRLISMTVKAAVSICERADKSLYFVLEEYMNKAGTRLIYYPVSAVQTTKVAGSYFGGGPDETNYLINLNRTDYPINKEELFILKERGEELTVVYLRGGGWDGFKHALKLKK